MLNPILYLLLLLLVPPTTTSTQSLKSTTTLPVPTYECLSKTRYQSAVIGVRSSQAGIVDTDNLANARKGGIANISVVFAACRGRSAVGEAEEFVKKVKRADFNGTVWLSTENYSDKCQWNIDQAGNCQYYLLLAQQLRNYYLQVGIATSTHQWSVFFGSHCQQLATGSLLWIDPNNNPSFSDFVPFGGWAAPWIKQFQQNVKMCEGVVDLLAYSS